MGKTIKGITIEIGGKTTPLQNSLKDVNKATRDVNSELRQVERLLKLDPSNPALLAQRFELLGDQVDNTEEKLKRLKEAQKQVEDQYKSGKIDGGQYREFVRELEATEAQLKKVQKEEKEAGEKAKKAGKDAEGSANGWRELKEDLKKVATAALGIGAIDFAVDKAKEFLGLAEATRETRENMAKLETSFETAGHSAEAAKGTYTELFGILGDEGQATEAAAHLAKLTDNEKELAQWTEIATGVYATFGDSLPIEGLTEAANETAKTGSITGALADALNWAGVNEDDFQKSLDACSSEQERQALITSTLNGLYSEAAQKYKEVNGDVIEARKATAEWNEAMAELGAIAEPIMTELTTLASALLEEIIPFVELIGEGMVGALNGADDAVQQLSEGLVGMVTFAVETLAEMLPTILDFALQLVAALGTGVAEALPTLVPTLIQFMADIALVLVENLPLLLEAALQLFQGLATGILEALPIIIEVLPELIQGIVDALVAFIPQIVETGITIFVALVEALPDIIDQICDALPQIITSVVEGLTALIPKLVECGVKLFVAIIQNLPQILVSIGRALPQIVSAIVNGLLQLVGTVAEAGYDLFTSLIDNSGSILATLGGFASELMSSVISILSGWFSSFSDIGYNIVSGIWSGLSAGWGWLTSQVSSLASSLLSAAKSALGIHSPSTKFRDEIGKMMAAGIGEGFNVEIPKTFNGVKTRLKSEEAKLASGMVSSVSTVNNSTSLGGINVYITGNVGSIQEARNYGNEIAENLSRQLRYKGVLSLA